MKLILTDDFFDYDDWITSAHALLKISEIE
jgi:hypothetical protein